VYQLPGGVTLAYELSLGNMIARCKGIDGEINFGSSIIDSDIIEVPNIEKHVL
jgi:hypothetical protein